jgi:hypothetical protein
MSDSGGCLGGDSASCPAFSTASSTSRAGRTREESFLREVSEDYQQGDATDCSGKIVASPLKGADAGGVDDFVVGRALVCLVVKIAFNFSQIDCNPFFSFFNCVSVISIGGLERTA